MKRWANRSPIVVAAFVLFNIMAPLLVPAIPLAGTAHAASDSYMVYMDPAHMDQIKTSVTTSDSAVSSFTDGMQYTSVYAKIANSAPIPFGAGSTAGDFQKKSAGSRIVSYYGDYYCGGQGKTGIGFERLAASYHIQLKINVTFNAGPPDLADLKNLAGSVAYVEAHVPQKASDGDTAGNLTNDVPASCLPTNLRKSTQNITLANYNKLSSSAKATWPTPETSVAINGRTLADQTDSSSKDNGDPDACSQGAGALAWMMCPVIELASNATKTLFNGFVLNELQADPLILTTNSTNNNKNGTLGDNLYKIWSSLRNLANITFIFIFMYIITANMLSFGASAYTIKKMLPRLIAAAILVQASFLVSALLIDIGNILGKGISSLVEVAIPATTSSTGSGGLFDALGGAVGFSLAAGAIFLIGVPTILLAVVSGFFAVLGVVVTVIARKLIISVLVILSPLAFAAWVLPGTENLFKQWWKLFVRIVMMYPIIVLIFSLATILSATTQPNHQDKTLASQIQVLLAGIYPIIAFMLVPWTFKWAGSVMNTVSNRISGLSSRAGKGIGNSQVAKDLKQDYQTKGAIRALNPNSTRGGKVLGSWMAGNLGRSGGRPNLRMAALVNKAQKERDDSLGEQFAGLTGDAGTATLVNLAGGKKVKGYANDHLTQVAAIRELAQRRQYDALRTIRDGEGGAPGIGHAALATAAQPVLGQLFEEAPDLATGKTGIIGEANAAKLAKMNASTIELAAKSPELAKAMLPKIQTITDNAVLRNGMDEKALGALLKHVDNFAGERITIPGKDGAPSKEVDGAAYLREILSESAPGRAQFKVGSDLDSLPALPPL